MVRRIVVDPVKLESASQKMDAQAAEYEKLYNQLFSEVDGMGAAWQGVDNEAFVNQIKGFSEDFQLMTKTMRSYSEFLKVSAKAYKDQQTEVANQARKLTN